MTTRYVSEGFAAAAVIKKTQSNTFVAEAYIVKTAGMVMPPQSGVLGSEEGFLGNFMLGELPVRNFTAQAVIQTTFSGSFSAAAILTTANKQVTFTAEAVIAPSAGFTFSVDTDTVTQSAIVGVFQPAANVSSVVLSRRNPLTGEWVGIYTTTMPNFSVTDYAPPMNVPFQYRFQSYDSLGAVIVEGYTSDVTIDTDKWAITIQNAYNLPLHITAAESSDSLQYEAFDTLGSTYKTVMHGISLGRQGSLSAIVSREDRPSVISQMERIIADPRQVYIRSPFGEVIPCVIGSVSEQMLVSGHDGIQFTYTQNGAA